MTTLATRRRQARRSASRIKESHNGKWLVERHDQDDGGVIYEVWSEVPYRYLFSIFESITLDAKALAQRVVADHNKGV